MGELGYQGVPVVFPPVFPEGVLVRGAHHLPDLLDCFLDLRGFRHFHDCRHFSCSFCVLDLRRAGAIFTAGAPALRIFGCISVSRLVSGWGMGARARRPWGSLQNARKPAFQPLRVVLLPQSAAAARKTGHTAILWGFGGAMCVRAGVDGGDVHWFFSKPGNRCLAWLVSWSYSFLVIW